MKKKIQICGVVAIACLWLGLSAFAWLKSPREISDTERRKLSQFPAVTTQNVFSGKFMTAFEDYTLDQFPLRDTFRQIKALFHYNVLRQGDNNDIYIAQGYAAQLEYPFREDSADYAIGKFNEIYETYLKDSGSKITFAVVPDKGYYLAERNGYPAMDYEAMFTSLEEGLPWATFVDLTKDLSAEDYYRTDTHWRQEKLMDVAKRLCAALGTMEPMEGDFTPVAMEKPFYGVYYGQAALPMEPETLYVMESDWLKDCTVTNFETGAVTTVYDMEKVEGKDLYEVFLSCSVSLLQIDNPHGSSDRELIVFRDSFGSSILPLIIKDYKTVTVVDTRYLPGATVGRFVEFHGQDVLFLYSTLVLNNSTTLK